MQSDIEDIWRYTAKTWSVQQANDYTDTLSYAFDELAAWPSRARACDEVRESYRRISIEHHMVYLRVEPYGVVIVRILHKAMDATRHL